MTPNVGVWSGREEGDPAKEICLHIELLFLLSRRGERFLPMARYNFYARQDPSADHFWMMYIVYSLTGRNGPETFIQKWVCCVTIACFKAPDGDWRCPKILITLPGGRGRVFPDRADIYRDRL